MCEAHPVFSQSRVWLLRALDELVAAKKDLGTLKHNDLFKALHQRDQRIRKERDEARTEVGRLRALLRKYQYAPIRNDREDQCIACRSHAPGHRDGCEVAAALGEQEATDA